MILSMSDEVIMAFVDGELDAGTAAHVRNALLNHECIRRRHEIYQTTRTVVARSFAPVAAEPVPERLTRAVATPMRGRKLAR